MLVACGRCDRLRPLDAPRCPYCGHYGVILPGAAMAEWVEVWGRETPTAARACLYWFPAAQWTDAFRDELLLTLDGQGVTDVEVRRVRDDEAEVGVGAGAIGDPKVCRCGHLSTQHRLVIDPGGARRGCILCGCLQFRDDGKAGARP